jgi:diguanylate cyclase (GGDEF)-like protein
MKKREFLPQPTFDKVKLVHDQLPQRSKPADTKSPFADSLKQFLEISTGDREIQAGEILFRENEPATNMYWIESGVLAIMQGDLDNPRLLGFRNPGQIVGEIALLENIPRTASVAAIAPTRLKSLSQDKFEAFLALIPGFGIELMRLLSSRLREIQPAEYSAGLYDHLTGALSRRAFDERLQEEVKRAQLYRYSFSLVFLDLDHFKEINDTYGHKRGDEVLITFVQRIMANLRTSDLLFRYGGDEFVAILQGTDRMRGQAMTQRMLDDTVGIAIPGDPPLNISFSAGIANFPSDGETQEDLLKVADMRVYQAKEDGRGRIGTD